MLYFLLPLVLFVAIYFLFLYYRSQKYQYNVAADYIYQLDKNLLLQTKMQSNTLQLPENYKNYDSLFLKISLSFNPFSCFFKPYIKIENFKHYFEYGAKGVRYINISHVKHDLLKINLKNLTLLNGEVSIYAYQNNINLADKILILAPHADDAEIAAFGLYKKAEDVTIVITTAGEYGSCNYCEIYNHNKTKQSLKKAELRIFDALCVPLLGNVTMQNCFTLGYFDLSLKWMYEHKTETASSLIQGINDMNIFRKVSHAKVKLSHDTQPTYYSFVDDIKNIVIQTKPDIILTPHPTIDSHSDHKHTTLALIHALKETNHKCKLLLYTNHLKLSRTYPIGEIHSSITLPPNKQDFYFDSIYSSELNHDLQIDKFFALESMHDLRDSLVFISIKQSFNHLTRMIKRKFTGKDKSYYKRAIRANELFFVVDSENMDKLLDPEDH
ncbi:MAG: PIG-L family deacetylase [Sulfurimonas sp.]|jgi:LmbE family N-acetylglucosaminyl deacetylase